MRLQYKEQGAGMHTGTPLVVESSEEATHVQLKYVEIDPGSSGLAPQNRTLFVPPRIHNATLEAHTSQLIHEKARNSFLKPVAPVVWWYASKLVQR